MTDPTYLTPEGETRMKAELKELTGPKRAEIAARLRSAIQMGDLSENADYSKAKEDQGFLEGRIQELEYILRNAEIIKVKASNGLVSLGSHITIQEADYPEETYHLVGATEADPAKGKISHESPIGQALIGHKIGDTVEAETPGGIIKLKILMIK
ncbi:MAG: transcription elongation factor GreA [Anaerolineae bacterium]|nr:transcription elongation factor GreA [Anaerolineae bacterium]MDK1080998.1 transcription elongation factor GreA [Anaerolineae bacterium]MDK1118635.1 transcription elongation factor GreA [Anaerolineae bacterium]